MGNPLSAGVLAGYRAKIQEIDADISRVQGARRSALLVFWVAIALSVLLGYYGIRKRIPVLLGFAPLCCAVVAGRRYAMSRGSWWRFVRLRLYYERGIARMEDRRQGDGFSGEEFREPHHVYDIDLRILGSGSLFELLCTARTAIGRRRLAEYLLRSCNLKEARARQDAVRELKPQSDLRERIATLGKYDFQESTWDTFSEWIGLPAETAPLTVRIAALACSATVGLLVLGGLATGSSLTLLARLALPPFAVAMVIAGFYRSRAIALNKAARHVGVEIAVVREGMELIAALPFRSTKLRAIQSCLNESRAGRRLRQLERLTNALAECDKPLFDLASQAMIMRTQLCFAIESWKLRYAGSLELWLDAWAEFEALSAISGYAWEHTDDPFPQFEEGPPAFEARNLGHPLIPVGTCVGNDVSLGADRRFYIVSGSNMSGKSTLMRSIGLNTVLAKAGAPVRADALQLTDLEVFASLSIVDSVLEGKSKFLAEVERIRLTLERARVIPVLFLIDEILSGTNSRDRRIASEAIVRTLVKNGAIGVLSTHDLALTEIAEQADLGGSNVHMGSRSASDAMDFDYLLKPGVTTETNALAIAAMMGVLP